MGREEEKDADRGGREERFHLLLNLRIAHEEHYNFVDDDKHIEGGGRTEEMDAMGEEGE